MQIGTNKWKKLIIGSLCTGLVALLLTGCGASNKAVKLCYVEWDSEVASTNVIGTVLEDMGYKVDLTPLDNAVMWQAVATGKSDGMVAAWLPNTHKPQYKEYGDKMVDLGPNLEGARVGLVVPDYMSVNSIADLTNEADKNITGIEPGSGAVTKTEQVLAEYKNLKGWKVTASSSGAMVTMLGKAIKDHQDIIITGWSPHWMFSTYKLKYLDDPKKIFGDKENIHTMVRKGLEKDNPGAYKILDNFHWTVADVESVMIDIANGATPKAAARKWVDANPDKVAQWTKGVEKV
jgi:glycine betaine/proline transport system substrate-binding protein